jgi:methyl-accepting chemotaxis protein
VPDEPERSTQGKRQHHLEACRRYLVLAILSLFVGFLFAKNLATPILYLADRAKSITSGDFSVDIRINRKDELGTLGEAFRAMVIQLRERLAFSQGILSGIVAPFIVADVNGKIIYLNEQILQYWGIPGKPEEQYGKTPGEFFYNGGEQKTPIDHVLENQEMLLDVPLTRINAKMEKKFMRITTSPFWDMDGNLMGACQLIIDETESRKQQNRVMALHEHINLSINEAYKIAGQQAAAFSRLNDQLGKTSQAADAQTGASDQTTQSISEMIVTLEGLAEKAKQTTEDTRATRHEAEDGRRVVTETVVCINKVADFAARTEAACKALSERATNITHVVELIKDIADQTNLLALNAAIEAARAGDLGRGFAVVADEVRKLAEKTMLATDEVGKSVSALQTEMSHTVELTGHTMEMVRNSTELAEKSGESLERIVAIADKAVGEVFAISSATTEQAHTGASIADSMQSISVMARQSLQNMVDSKEFVKELERYSSELKQIIDSMSHDRRGEERITVDSPYVVSLKDSKGASCDYRIVDISLSGIRLETVTGGSVDFGEHEIVRIIAGKPPLQQLLDNAEGSIAWKDGPLCSVRFAKPLSGTEDDLIRAVAATQRGWHNSPAA